ncbi:copia protein [Tanacetum coccineum]
MMRTQRLWSQGVARPKFDKDTRFELKDQFIKELREHTFSGSENKDANEHIERVLEIVDLFTTPNVTQDQLMSCFPYQTTEQAGTGYETSTRSKSSNTSDGLAAIQAQLNNLVREIKKVNKRVYAAQVGCELCNGPHYTKDCPLKE